jgi:hypothetical protein
MHTHSQQEADAAWNSLIATLEFDIAELQHEQSTLNFWHPEAIDRRFRKLEAAKKARRQGWAARDWAAYDTLKQADEEQAAREMISTEAAAEAELSE